MSSSVYTDASIERVWKTISEANRWPEWSKACTEVWGVAGDSQLSIGQKFGFKLRMARRNVPFNVTVGRVESARMIEWRSTKYSITAIRTISLVLENNGCRVTDSKHLSSPLLPIRLAYPRFLIRRMTERWLDDIKNESESFP